MTFEIDKGVSPPEKKVADFDARAKNSKSLIILSNTLSLENKVRGGV